MTRPQRSFSWAMKRLNTSAPIGVTRPPMLANAARTSGSCNAASVASVMRAAMSSGVRTGASRPNHAEMRLRSCRASTLPLRPHAEERSCKSFDLHERVSKHGPARTPSAMWHHPGPTYPSRRLGAGQRACAKPPQDEVGRRVSLAERFTRSHDVVGGRASPGWATATFASEVTDARDHTGLRPTKNALLG